MESNIDKATVHDITRTGCYLLDGVDNIWQPRPTQIGILMYLQIFGFGNRTCDLCHDRKMVFFIYLFHFSHFGTLAYLQVGL